MGATKEVLVPDIGDFKNVPVIEVMVRLGDIVKPEDPLITLESDKAAMDVPAPFGGAVKDLKVKVGDRVSEGSPILVLEDHHGSSAPAPATNAKAPGLTAPPRRLLRPWRHHQRRCDPRPPPQSSLSMRPQLGLRTRAHRSVAFRASWVSICRRSPVLDRRAAF